jgi:outer membrane murein-binding lipoprotein Lpp
MGIGKYFSKNFWSGVGEELLKNKYIRGAVTTVSNVVLPGSGAAVDKLMDLGSHALDRFKDMSMDAKLSGFSTDIGDLKNGLSDAKAQIETQGKELHGKIDAVKSELQESLKQQKEKTDQDIKNLDAKIATLSGEQKKQAEEQKKELKKQKEELTSAINEVESKLTEAQNKLRKELDDFRNEVNERFEQQEQKILNNKRKIEDERRNREEEIRETHSKIKLTTTNIENLRKEKAQLEDDFLNYKASINQQTADTQQAFEDAEAEFDRRTRIVETKIEDNQEQLEEFNEQLINTQREQAFQRTQQEQIWEELQETNDILSFQQQKLSLVAERMEDINEDIHERMDNIQGDHHKLFTLATETSQKVSNLTEQVQNISKKTVELENQVKENKQNLEKVKKEAKLANERIDNFLKAQTLSDFSAEQSSLDKIQKSLELKAEESKLLATLKLLQETKKLIKPKPAQKNWKVGVKTGTAPKDFQEPEGYQLVPNSRWERKYTGDQVKPDNPHALFTPEWFKWEEENKLAPEDTKLEWGERIKHDNESAPLTTPKRRQEEQISAEQTQDNQTTEEEKQSELFLAELEEAKTEILSRLQEIQEQVSQNLEPVEQAPKKTSFQSQLTTTQKKITQLKSQLEEKENNIALAQQKLTNQIPKEYWETESGLKNWIKQNQTEQKQINQELNQIQAQLSDPALQLEQAIDNQQEQIVKQKQEELQKDWEKVQDLSEQVLQDKPPKIEEQHQENQDQNPLAELVKDLQKLEANLAASQKQMSKWMLFVIIFLLEYVVYKKQGVLGLAVLNTLLLIAYNYREELKKYADLWNKYLLIIGYVVGNTLAYSAPEQEKYKWPSVIGFNLIIFSIYAYTLYQQKQEQTKLETVFQEKTAQIAQEHQITSQEWKTTNNANFLGVYNPFSNQFVANKTQQLNNLNETIKEKNLAEQLAQQKALELQQQAEILQRSAEIESNLKEIHANLGESKITWTKIKEKYPDFAEKSTLLKELAHSDKLLRKSGNKELSQVFLTKLQRISDIAEEETNLLSNLRLSLEQLVAISCQATRFTREEKEYLSDNYGNLTQEQQLSLLNGGLNSLGIDDLEKKENFVELNHALHNEKQCFGLSVKEKEQILRFLTNTLNLSPEQKERLEQMGIKFFNASEWEVDEEQKDHLLDFGLNRLILTEEQKENLTDIHPDQFRTFSLTGEQKNILNSLAPLIREDKYSNDSLQLLKSLNLKPTTQTFLVQEEIIPDPHLAFGTPKSSYLPLKEKFLKGEQKALRKLREIEDKKLSEEKFQENKLSIVIRLTNKWRNCSYKSNLSLSEWVKREYLTAWQADILLTCGFKTVPKYNFFELLIFAVEKFTNQNWNEFLSENEDLNQEFKKYLKSLENKEITINETIWEKFVSSQSKDQQEIFKNLNLQEIAQQVSQILGNWNPPQELKPTEAILIAEETTATEAIKIEEPSTSTSRYDDLLSNLNKEDSERTRKKEERKAAKNKFEEAERQRREQKLIDKDQKLKEDEEKRQQEKELADKEEQKRREADEARNKALQEDQERIFNNKLKNIEEAKKRAEEALENQKKANELAEKKKKDEIEQLEKENQEEQKRLANQAKLIEEEKQKKLAAIALEDTEQRQRIEREANAEKARILQEANDKKRKNEAELKKKENELLKQQESQKVELERLQKEADLQNRIAEETKRIGREQERILKANRDKESQLRAFRESLWNEVKNYYWASNEARDGTRDPNLTSGGYLRDWLNSYPSMKFNLVGGDQFSCNWTNNSWKTAMQAFYRTAGNTFVDQYQFQRLLNEKVRDLGFLN